MNNEWFRHDYNAHEDIKQKRLLKRHGVSALGFYWYLVELLYQNGGMMSDKDVRLEAELLDSLDYLDSFIEFELFTFEDGVWSCPRIIDELNFKKESRQKRSDAGKKGMASRWGNNVIKNDNDVITNDNKTEKTITTDNTLTFTNTNKEKEILSNDNIPKKKVSSDLLFSPEKEKDTTPYDDIISYWNKGAVKFGFSQFTKMTEQRKKAICCRWNEYGEKVYEAMDKVFASDFCKSGSWCGFDWVFKPSNMVKVLEGNYDNRTSNRGFKKDVTGRYDNLESEVIEL